MHYEAELVILVLLALVCESYVIRRVVEGDRSIWMGSDGMAHPHAFLDWELRISVV